MRIDDKRTYETRSYPGFITGFFALSNSLSYYPKVLFEVFVRTNFGERYFFLSRSILITIVLGIWPWAKYKAITLWKDYQYPVGWDGKETFALDFSIRYISWYLFLVAYIFAATKRFIEIKRRSKKGHINFAHDTTYFGDAHPIFYTLGHPETRKKLKMGNLSKTEYDQLKFNSSWTIGVILEPLPFLVIGLLLWPLGQSLGLPMAISAVLYGLGLWAEHFNGRQLFLNQSDNMLRNKRLTEWFSQGKKETGTNPVGREEMTEKPNNRKEDDPFKVT